MDQCKRDGCGSYAINDHKESGLCDKCYWIEQAEKLTKERDKLNNELGKLLAVSVLAHVDEHFPLVFASAQEALKEST